MKKILSVVFLVGALLASVAHAGVSNIDSNGRIDGNPSYRVTCTSGKTVIIYKRSGTWYTGGLGQMGRKYDSWSTSDVASYLCR